MSRKWTQKPKLFGSLDFLKISPQSITMVLCVLALGACGPVDGLFSRDDSPDTMRTVSGEGAVVAPLAGDPAVNGDRPLQPGQSGLPYSPDGMPALQPARGVNLATLFSDDIRDPMTRIRRVENAVLDLRRDFEAVLPAIVRLSAVEQDIQDLVVQLRSLLREEPPPARTPPSGAPQALTRPAEAPVAERPDDTASVPVPAPDRPQVATDQRPVMLSQTIPPDQDDPAAQPPPSAPAIPGAPVASHLRLGEHRDKTRIVLDANGSLKMRHDLDNIEKLLIIELPDAGWSGPMNWSTSTSPLISSYSVHDMNGSGTRIVVQLKHAATLINEISLSDPDRYVMDLRSDQVHR